MVNIGWSKQFGTLPTQRYWRSGSSMLSAMLTVVIEKPVYWLIEVLEYVGICWDGISLWMPDVAESHYVEERFW